MKRQSQPRGATVLLLEDELLIALDIQQLLSDAGFTDVHTLSSCIDAEKWLRRGDPALAIVDPGLRDGICVGVARTLVARHIPFIVYSGSLPGEVDAQSPFAFGHWLSKPRSPTQLFDALDFIQRQPVSPP